MTKHNASSLPTHVENSANLMEGKTDNFWKLDLLRIQEKELSFCVKVMEDIMFEIADML